MKSYSQESRLYIPLDLRAIQHQRRTETEHDRNHIGQSETPSGSTSSKSLGRYFGCVCVPDG